MGELKKETMRRQDQLDAVGKEEQEHHRMLPESLLE